MVSMKNMVLRCLLASIFVVAPIQAQQQTVPVLPPPNTTTQMFNNVLQENYAQLSASDTGGCQTANACVILNLGPMDSTFNVTASGTWSGTQQIEGTAGNGVWANIGCMTLTQGATVSNFTANGGWACNAAGLVGARVRTSTYTSGTANIAIASGQAQLALVTNIPQNLGSTATPTFVGVNATGLNTFNGINSKVYVTTNFTTANSTNFQPITGLSWAFPSVPAFTVGFHCAGTYSQATGNAAVTFGVNVTAAPTNLQIEGIQETAATTVGQGVSTITTATSSGASTGTPGATATNYAWFMDGHLENAASTANTMTINVKTATGADAVTVLQDSVCHLIY